MGFSLDAGQVSSVSSTNNLSQNLNCRCAEISGVTPVRIDSGVAQFKVLSAHMLWMSLRYRIAQNHSGAGTPKQSISTRDVSLSHFIALDSTGSVGDVLVL